MHMPFSTVYAELLLSLLDISTSATFLTDSVAFTITPNLTAGLRMPRSLNV